MLGEQDRVAGMAFLHLFGKDRKVRVVKVGSALRIAKTELWISPGADCFVTQSERMGRFAFQTNCGETTL